jgi:hypothetical protein
VRAGGAAVEGFVYVVGAGVAEFVPEDFDVPGGVWADCVADDDEPVLWHPHAVDRYGSGGDLDSPSGRGCGQVVQSD